MQDKSIGDGQRVYINKDASLSLDTRSFYLELTVNRAAMQAAILPRTNMLGESTAQNLSSVLNYSMGSYYNKYENTDNASSYLTLDNTRSLREHHLNFNGSLYGIGTGNRRVNCIARCTNVTIRDAARQWVWWIHGICNRLPA